MHNQNKEGVDLDRLEAIEHAARICESYCACDNGEDDEEINRILRSRAAQIRDLARRAEPSVAAGDVCALDKTIVEPSKFVLGFWIDDGRIEFAKGDFSTLKDGAYNIVTAPVLASPAVSQKDGAAVDDPMDDRWHSLTCDGTCSPPCEDAPRIPAATTASASERDAALEEAARVCDAGVQSAQDWDSSYWDQACENRAAAIRALKDRAQAPSRDATPSDDDVALALARRWKARAEKAEAALANSGASHASNAGEDTERDAARYRWLRTQRGVDGDLPVDGDVWVVQFSQPRGAMPELRCAGFGSKLDRAIDAATSAELEKKA